MAVPFAESYVIMTYLISSWSNFRNEWVWVETDGIQELDHILKKLECSGSSEHQDFIRKFGAVPALSRKRGHAI